MSDDFEEDRKICDAMPFREFRVSQIDKNVVMASDDRGSLALLQVGHRCTSMTRDQMEQVTIFCITARNRWPAALDRIAELEQQVERMRALVDASQKVVIEWMDLQNGNSMDFNDLVIDLESALESYKAKE